MESRVEIIYRIYDECDGLRYSYIPKLCQSIIHPLMLCLSDEELIQMYWECIEEKRLVNRVESLIKSRISEKGYSSFTSLIEQIYLNLVEANWNKYRRIRRFFSEIIMFFPDSYILEFFDYFYRKEKPCDRRKAYAVASAIWSAEMEQELWEGLFREGSDVCLTTLIEKGNIKKLSSLFKEIWKHPQISFWLKTSLMKRLARENFKSLLFLKKDTPVSYLYASVLANKNLSEKEVMNLVMKAKNQKEFGFGLWCVGKLQMWNTLLELNSKFPQLQKKYNTVEAQK